MKIQVVGISVHQLMNLMAVVVVVVVVVALLFYVDGKYLRSCRVGHLT